ncbi:hypothetical protein AB0B50_38975 [Streptomyces sp. NPDC041068]|uniref:hypothetical protein n=1 Tax=Streptomyces sp. NPDC041068 TaxID=3155130 RepID=UPI0033EF7BA3
MGDGSRAPGGGIAPMGDNAGSPGGGLAPMGDGHGSPGGGFSALGDDHGSPGGTVITPAYDDAIINDATAGSDDDSLQDVAPAENAGSPG